MNWKHIEACCNSEEGDWYLANSQTLDSKLAEAEEEMESAKDAMDRAQEEYDLWSRTAESLRARLRDMRIAKVAGKCQRA